MSNCVSAGVTKTSIYHFLCGPLGQQVSVAQVVDFDVLDVVAIRDVHVAIDLVGGSCSARVAACGGFGTDWRDVDMLDALARLELSIDLGRGGSCGCVSTLARETKLGLEPSLGCDLPAAAAGSTGDLAGDAPVSRSLDNGLLSRAESSLRAEGDRERRSNLEALRGSGSFWSKRDRLAVRRSVSSMVGDWIDGDQVSSRCCPGEKVVVRSGIGLEPWKAGIFLCKARPGLVEKNAASTF